MKSEDNYFRNRDRWHKILDKAVRSVVKVFDDPLDKDEITYITDYFSSELKLVGNWEKK